MDEEARVQDLIAQLNASLGDFTPYKLALVDPAKVELTQKNAHYMSKRVYQRLLDNVKQDRNLSSLPFCWQREDGSLEALSGNHRVLVAKEAGVPRILVLYTDEKLSRGERVSIQLSHNALVGRDNASILRELWGEIDELSDKLYTGLDDNALKTMESLRVDLVDEAGLRFEEIGLLFLPSETERVKEVLGRLQRVGRAAFAARVEDFDRFFEQLLRFKEAACILNTSTAILALMDIAEGWLQEHEGEAQVEPPKEPKPRSKVINRTDEVINPEDVVYAQAG